MDATSRANVGAGRNGGRPPGLDGCHPCVTSHLHNAAASVMNSPGLAALWNSAPDDWTPGTILDVGGKYLTTGNQRGYHLLILTDGKLRLEWSTNGTDVLSRDSTVAVGLVNGKRKFIRGTLDVDNGAAGHDVKFYTSDDGVNWTQLGTTVTTGGTTSIFSNTAGLTRFPPLRSRRGDRG